MLIFFREYEFHRMHIDVFTAILHKILKMYRDSFSLIAVAATGKSLELLI